MKRYTVKQYTKEEWEAKFEAEYEADEISNEEDVINIVWSDRAVCMDIMANGKRLVPILRKIEESMTEAGLAGDSGIYAGWFGQWADALRDPFDKKYFIWKYDGRQDMEQGHWSYSWEIEQIDEDRWYIYLNLARPEQQPTTDTTTDTENAQNGPEKAEEKKEENKMFEVYPHELTTLEKIAADMEKYYTNRSAWDKGVHLYALDMLEEYATNYGENAAAPCKADLLNGADNWEQYSYGGSALVYDGDIAERLCSPSELKKTRNGDRSPNGRETWLDVQARALNQAAQRILNSARRVAREAC